MLTNEDRDEISQRMTAIANAMPGFRRRQGQRVMIAAVAKTFSRHSATTAAPSGATILCANGGTGIGKSLAYSIPGAVMARRKGMKLVIATATVSLQDQLVDRDLPFFFKAAGLPVTVALAKSRTRYVCRYRLQALVPPQAPSAERDAHQVTWRHMAETLESGAWDGDRDTYDPVPSDALWQPITTDRHGCLGTLCAHARDCCQSAARNRLREADVLVANHDYVLADIAMGGGKLLPPPANTFYIFDEAHHLAEKAVASVASSHLLGSDRRAIARLLPLITRLEALLGSTLAPEAMEALATSSRALGDWLDQALAFFSSLAMLHPTASDPQPVLDFEDSFVPEEFEPIGAGVLHEVATLIALLRLTADTLYEGAIPGARTQREQLLIDVGRAIGRFEGIAKSWQLFMLVPPAGQPPIAKWVTTVARHDGLDFELSASPVLADQHLRDRLWTQAAGVVLASANLATLGDFTHFQKRTGLSTLPAVTCVDLPSPFDYQQQGRLEIPAMRHSPGDYEAHTAEVTEKITSYLAEGTGGTLILFTSKTQMMEVARQLPEALRRFVLVQGSDSKARLLAQHKAAIDLGEHSAILGLESFSEGVDLAGEYCTHVVVTRLPFSVPNDPVCKALCQWIDTCGGWSFVEVLVPAAARKLEQRVGRLIRTEKDSGRVTVLDTRLWDKSYGRMMLRGLPPFRLFVRDLEVHV